MVKVFSARKVQDRRGGTKRERERGGEMRSDQTHIILYATLPICHERLHGTEVHPTSTTSTMETVTSTMDLARELQLSVASDLGRCWSGLSPVSKSYHYEALR